MQSNFPIFYAPSQYRGRKQRDAEDLVAARRRRRFFSSNSREDFRTVVWREYLPPL